MVSHTTRVTNYANVLMGVTKGSATPELAFNHGNRFHKEARKLTAKAKAGSPRHYGWRKDYLEAARAWYAVARKLANESR
jgi:hypothetical protein